MYCRFPPPPIGLFHMHSLCLILTQWLPLGQVQTGSDIQVTFADSNHLVMVLTQW